MARISSEEKRREASDWFIGLMGIALVLIALLIGYFTYRHTVVRREAQRVNQKTPASMITFPFKTTSSSIIIPFKNLN